MTYVMRHLSVLSNPWKLFFLNMNMWYGIEWWARKIICCIPAKPKTYYAKRNSNSLSLLFAFLLMNSLGKQAVSPGSINQCVEIALLFLCVYIKSVLLKISRYSFFTKWTSSVLF